MAADPDALECALRSLRHRDRSVRELEQRLRLRGFSESEREQAIETLLRTGVVDDHRFADARAHALAERGAGDALIRHRLELAGVSAELVEQVLQAVPPETDRARLLLSRRGGGAKTARYLIGKGFSDDVVDALIPE